MLDEELRTARLEVRVARQGGRTLDEAVVGRGRISMCGRTGVVECGEDTWRTTFFDEITNDLVVEVLDWCPLYLFPDVLLLFGLEGELNEDLLKLLVDVVDTELLKRVVLSYRVS